MMLFLLAPLIVLASDHADLSRVAPHPSGRAQRAESVETPAPVVDSLPGHPVECIDPRTGTAASMAAQRISFTGGIDSMWQPDTVNGLAERIALTRHLRVGDGNGGSYLAWADGSRGEPDIRIQRFGPGGLPAEGWPLDGVPACVASGSQYQPDFATDGEGGVFLVWNDFRSGAAALHAQRIAAGGSMVHDWPVDGMPVCLAASAPSNPRIAADGQGGAFVVWEDRRHGGLTIFAIRLSADGSIAAGWPSEGVALSPVSGRCAAPQIAVASLNRALVTWSETSNGAVFRAVLLGPQAPAGESTPSLAITNGATEVGEVALQSMGDGDIIAAWAEWHGSNASLRAQRLATTPALLARWSSGGEIVHEGTLAPSRPALLVCPDSGLAIAWEGGPTGEQARIYLRRLTPQGLPASGWEQGARAICVEAGDPFGPALIQDGEEALIAIWNDPVQAVGVHANALASTSNRAVSLVSAMAAPGRARVVWRITDPSTLEFRGERSMDDAEWQDLGSLSPSAGDTLVLEDRGLSDGARVRYRLAFKGPGVQSHSEAVELVIPLMPRLLELRSVRALGSEHALLLAFALPRGEAPRVDLMDVMGRRVAQRRFEGLDPGEQQVRWALSSEIASGVYFLRLSQGSRSRGAKVIYVR